jgi:hypothetical protein
MSVITKGDLKETYSWTAIKGDDPKVSGEPDSTLFSRHEGYEVIYLINKFCEKHQLVAKTDALKAEYMIKNGLPSTTRKQTDVMEWLASNWTKYTRMV